MKSPPKLLPAANSRKWHSRRVWDPIGYLRVRSLSNPSWHREPMWLVRVLTSQRRYALPADHPLYDRATAAARRYPRTAAGLLEPEDAWDEVLTAVDALLVVRQERHLAAVRAAGCSGTSSGESAAR